MTQAEVAASPFEQMGGARVVRDFVDRFYDLMADAPEYGALRALHAPVLTPMRASLSGFLSGWLGGPRDWFDQNPGKCMMSAHSRIDVSRETADQWCAAMARALAETGVDPELAARINTAFGQMARGMVRG